MGRKVLIFLLCLMVALPGISFAAKDSEHWIYPELKEYKQMVAPYKNSSSFNSWVNREEWVSFTNHVLNPAQWDEPIQRNDWATMVKMGMELPQGQENLYLDYIYGQLPVNAPDMTREAAVGGTVKLLSASIVKPVWDNSQADAADVFRDFSEINDMYSGLVRIAYREKLLDSATADRFLPKNKLTHAEAISIMYKIMKKYEQEKPLLQLPEDHWASADRNRLRDSHFFTRGLQEKIQLVLTGDQPVTASLWNEMVKAVLRLTPSQAEIYWSTTVEQATLLTRDQAVADLVRLAWPNRTVTEKDQIAAAQAFSDYRSSLHPEELAIAYSLRVVVGNDTGFRPADPLACSEALTLLSRTAGILYGK